MMETLRRVGLTLVGCVLLQTLWAARILVPMDDSQTNHLKAYGVAFWVLENGVEVEWLGRRGGWCAVSDCAGPASWAQGPLRFLAPGVGWVGYLLS